MEWKHIVSGSHFELWQHNYLVGQFKCRTVVVKLPQRFIIYSPGRGLTASFSQHFNVTSEEQIDIIFPNHWHHLGVTEWEKAFPKAKKYAHPQAMPRLRLKGHQKILDLMTLESAALSFTCLPDSKTGEAWLEITTPSGRVWVVGDAFFNYRQLPKAFIMASVFKLFKSGPGLSISRLYLYLAVKDKTAYKRWLLAKVQDERPYLLVPNHGSVVRENTQKMLEELIERRL